MSWSKNSARGFSLLEVMVAIAILAVSLLVILNLQSNAVIASGRAQSMNVATLLARHQMAQLLLEMEKEMGRGYFPTDKSEQGDFSELGYPTYRWELQIRRVEIPPPPIPEEAGGEVFAKIVESITEQIGEATREMKLTVYWKELEEEEESIDVVTHLVSLGIGRGGATTTTTTTTEGES